MEKIKKIIGINISQIRRKRQYTQAELAEFCCLGTSTISNIEQGIDGISLPKLYIICDVLRRRIIRDENIRPESTRG